MRLSWIGVALPLLAVAQSPIEPALSTAQKWDRFEKETVAPFSLGAGAFNAAISQATQSTPLYGRGWPAYSQRFGASVGDIASQNFFGDFVLASAFHEDPRYFRMGPGNSIARRVGYALSRIVITKRDSGRERFNFSNVVGTGMGIALLLNQGISTLIAAVFLPVVGNYGYAAMFLFWALCTMVYFSTAAFFLPETKGKTLEEIEAHFDGGAVRGVSAS